MRTRSLAGAVLPSLLPLLLLLGCASTPPPPVPVGGDEAALAALDGEWHGEYWSGSTGRRGSIRFRMESDAHAAWGDVWMSPAPHAPSAAEPGGPSTAGAAEPLQIRFVRVAAGVVSGTLEPYRDPECSCMVSTTFHGTIAGDAIRGTYTTRGPRGHLETGGEWEARRAATSGAA
jgi:hypothetical protein